MNLSESVFEIAESFMQQYKYVKIDYKDVEKLAEDMKKTGKTIFNLPEEKDIGRAIFIELAAGAINYCYWYGKSSICPNQANSSKMFELVLNAFEGFTFDNKHLMFEICIDRLCKKLALNRFPLLEDRVRHLNELNHGKAIDFVNYVLSYHDTRNIQDHMEGLIGLFPGYASDIFLKRASLFFIQLYRRFGWFAEDLKTTHVPADYQIPKMLNYLGYIDYIFDLKFKIINNKLIPKGSQSECEIRSATILVMKKLCELTGWNIADVDTYLFLRRHEVTNPFHLTITTDY